MARRRPNQFIGRARANVPARGASPSLPAPPRSPDTGIGFAPETIAPRRTICRTLAFMEKR